MHDFQPVNKLKYAKRYINILQCHPPNRQSTVPFYKPALIILQGLEYFGVIPPIRALIYLALQL